MTQRHFTEIEEGIERNHRLREGHVNTEREDLEKKKIKKPKRNTENEKYIISKTKQ